MKITYSLKTFLSFLVLLVAYGLIVLLLVLLNNAGILKFNTVLNGDLLPLVASLPFVAFYILVLLSATAGFARSAIMMKALPFDQIFKTKLQGIKMNESSISTKIRSGSQVEMTTPLLTALTNVNSSRVPILAVIDNNNKVNKVITNHDILERINEEIDKTNHDTLYDRLNKIKVEDLNPRDPVTVSVNDNIQDALGTMLRKGFTKLIVVEDTGTKTFAGTVDVLDLVGEIYDDSSNE